MKKFEFVVFALLILLSANLIANETLLMKAAKTELQRSMKGLHSEEYPPYFISYEISEINSTGIIASFGKIKSYNNRHSRIQVE
jgi:hypothetical protein